MTTRSTRTRTRPRTMLGILYELMKKVYTGFGAEKQFVFNFDIYDGSEGEDNVINDTNVVQYEFVNLGTTVCVINDMPLYPVASGKEFYKYKPEIVFNENDVSVYKFKFTGKPDFFITDILDETTTLGHTVGTISLFEGAGVDRGRTYESELYNRLLVISKVKANKKSSNPS